MNKIATALGTLSLGLLLFFLLSSSSVKPSDELPDSGFALVELFTSQGCSSCPPADRLLSGLMEEAANKGQEIYLLSFHVDYWNYLGWTDPFSKKGFSTRQRRYAATLSTGVYTPQMVFNGRAECVGSNRTRVLASLQKVMEQEATDKIKLNLVQVSGQKAIRVDYEVEGNLKDKVINVALVERNISTQVKRGENGGRKLHHDNVVREFQTVELTGKGAVMLNLPSDLNKSKSAVIAFTQDQTTLEVFGAARATP